jgi:hypothetical protein
MAIGIGIGLSPSFGGGAGRPFPAAQTITWGAKTLTGHGAHLLNYTGSGTLSITSQKDASNADVTIWQMGQNGLSWKGASATYASAAPASLNGPYTVIVDDGTYSSTVTINILANAFHIREMTATGANGGRWATDSMYTVDGTATSGPTQLRTLLQNATLVRGDTIWCRDGIFNPTSAEVRMRIKVGGYTGSGMITIRSDTVDTSVDQYGMPNRMHGAEMRRLIFDDANLTGDIYVPIRFEDMWLSSTRTTDAIVTYADTDALWGVSAYNCRLAGAPTITADSLRGITLRGSQTDVAYVQYCTLTNLGRGIVVQSSTGGVGGRTKGALIQHNDAYGMFEDFITDSGEATVVEHNFARDWQYLGPGPHPDGYQHVHDGVAPTTYDGPKVRYNIWVTNTDLATYTFQAYFTDDSALARTLTNVEFKWNIGTCITTHGVTMARMTGPVAQFNTVLSLVTPGVDLGGSTTPTTTAVAVPSAPKNGTDGTFNYNVANDVSVTPQTGTVVSTPNAELSSGGGATSYATAFPGWAETGITSRALAKSACTPADVLVAADGVKNPDDTYNGAIGPDGDWNTGAAY